VTRQWFPTSWMHCTAAVKKIFKLRNDRMGVVEVYPGYWCMASSCHGYFY